MRLPLAPDRPCNSCPVLAKPGYALCPRCLAALLTRVIGRTAEYPVTKP